MMPYPFHYGKIVAYLMLAIFHQLEGIYIGDDEDFGITSENFEQEVNNRTIYTVSCIIRDDFELPIDALETMVADYAKVSIIHPVVVGYTVDTVTDIRNFTRLIIRVACI